MGATSQEMVAVQGSDLTGKEKLLLLANPAVAHRFLRPTGPKDPFPRSDEKTESLLANDAWVGFLTENGTAYTTRESLGVDVEDRLEKKGTLAGPLAAVKAENVARTKHRSYTVNPALNRDNAPLVVSRAVPTVEEAPAPQSPQAPPAPLPALPLPLVIESGPSTSEAPCGPLANSSTPAPPQAEFAAWLKPQEVARPLPSVVNVEQKPTAAIPQVAGATSSRKRVAISIPATGPAPWAIRKKGGRLGAGEVEVQPFWALTSLAAGLLLAAAAWWIQRPLPMSDYHTYVSWESRRLSQEVRQRKVVLERQMRQGGDPSRIQAEDSRIGELERLASDLTNL